MKKVAIVQPNYIPWKGYFDMMNYVDEFILFDTVQYTKRDWRNRNLIKTPQGLLWLTIPVEIKGNFNVLIKDIRTDGIKWQKKHWASIKQYYQKAPYFKYYQDLFEEFYCQNTECRLALVDYQLIKIVNQILGIQTHITWASDYEQIADEKNLKLIHLCQQAGADLYVSGPAAKDYLEQALFDKFQIVVNWADYSNYPAYNQLYGQPFEQGVSILDLIFNEGPNATNFLKTFTDAPFIL